MSLDEIDQANGVLMPVYDGDVEMIYLIGKVKPLQQTYTKLIKVLLQMGSKTEPALAWFEFSSTCILPRNVIIHLMQSWEPLHLWLLAQYIIFTLLQRRYLYDNEVNNMYNAFDDVPYVVGWQYYPVLWNHRWGPLCSLLVPVPVQRPHQRFWGHVQERA